MKLRFPQSHSDAIALATIAVIVFDVLIFAGSIIILLMWQMHGAPGADVSRFLLLSGVSAVVNLAPAALLLVLGSKAAKGSRWAFLCLPLPILLEILKLFLLELILILDGGIQIRILAWLSRAPVLWLAAVWLNAFSYIRPDLFPRRAKVERGFDVLPVTAPPGTPPRRAPVLPPRPKLTARKPDVPDVSIKRDDASSI